MQQDLLAIADWWLRVGPTMPTGLAALWFGITDIDVGGKAQRTLYVAGCDSFDADDSSGDWASAPYAWWPPTRYVTLPGLAALAGHDYVAVLDYAVELVSSVEPQRGAMVDGVAIGFDDGDFRVVWSRTSPN